ncbi:hypothetical protein BFW01_g12265 [Lasiodiplodia theobromae]|nr:hypothetical protein BFW01_g12265 [Lasiodiplodia theobromae]
MPQFDPSEYPLNSEIQGDLWKAREFEKRLCRRKFYDGLRWPRDSDGDLIMVDAATEVPVWFNGPWQHPGLKTDLESGPMRVDDWGGIEDYDETAGYDDAMDSDQESF